MIEVEARSEVAGAGVLLLYEVLREILVSYQSRMSTKIVLFPTLVRKTPPRTGGATMRSETDRIEPNR